MIPPIRESDYPRRFIPWYDSQALGLAVILLSGLILLFGIIGIGVARANPLYLPFIWVPILLILLCGLLIASIALRLILRSMTRLFR